MTVNEDMAKMLSDDNRRMRAAGTVLAEAALYTVREFDGLHRLSLAVAGWATAVANEGGRGDRHAAPSAPAEPPKVPSLDFVTAMGIARSGFQDWATKPHNSRWVRKIDGTPIPNDLLVTVALAFVAAAASPDAPPPSSDV